MKKLSQAPNVFPSQSIEDYQVHGPSKVENSDERFFQDQDTRFVLEFMDIKEKYNQLRQEGKTHGQAWKESQAYILPLERQMLMKQEIEKNNPGFYSESKDLKTLITKSAEKRLNGDYIWNISYSKEDIEKISNKILDNPNEDFLLNLEKCGLNKESILSLFIKH